MSDNGYLTPEGILEECDSYEHCDKAREICESLGQKFLTGVQAENYLLDKGYVVVRTRDVYARLGYVHGDTFQHLTDAQRKWFEDNYDSFLPVKQRAVDELMDLYDKE